MWKLLGAMVLATAGLISSSGPTLAANLDLKALFSGQVSAINQSPLNPLGYVVSQAINGTILFQDVADTPTVNSVAGIVTTTFTFGTGSWSLSTGQTGASTGGSIRHVNFFGIGDGTLFANNAGSLSFRLAFNGPTTLASLTNLNGLPTSAGTTVTLFQGLSATPLYTINLSSLTFQAAAATTTPVPAALPFFASGLLSLGVIAWRRRRRTSSV
jgi:hypothetical protein